MGKIACAHPGKIGDALYTLPAIRELARRHGSPADFYTSEYCRPLTELFEAQACIDRMVVSGDYALRSFDCGAQPWRVPVPPGYDAVYQMGFRRMPKRPLPDHIAVAAGLPTGLPIQYDFEPKKTLDAPYIVVASRGPTTFSSFFHDLVEACPVAVVEVGALGEATGSSKSIDKTGADMLETLSWIAGSSGFVGMMSSMLVLANGFQIPKVAPHDGRSWDMSHVMQSPYNHYPVHPTPEHALLLLGHDIPRHDMKYSKTLQPSDYAAIHEMRHAVNIRDLVNAGRFDHQHRAWEYGIVMRALRENHCQTVLDVGGGGSTFAPAVAWLGMKVTQVDPGDCAAWVAAQSRAIGQDLPYVQSDFMAYEGPEVDAVTCLSVLEHVPDDQAFFRKLAGYVRPGGILALTVDFWPDGQAKCGAHLRTYNEERLRELAASVSGFEPLGGFDYGHVGGYVNGYTFASLILRRSA